MEINQISPQETKFTEVLAPIELMPKMLFYYGKIPEICEKIKQNPNQDRKQAHSHNQSCNQNHNQRPHHQHHKTLASRPKSVAIVGTRKNTAYGEKIAYELSYALAKKGVVIISGLAIGIDTIAHRGALDGGGITVGILGTPINKIYPRSNEKLAREIIRKGGAIMSEIGIGQEFFPKVSFLERNRIISGLADIVVVVEANERSGSLNTAMHAIEQGRELFAVPGNIDHPTSQGCNKLIREGATPYTGIDDITRLLFPNQKKKSHKQLALFGDNQFETAILKNLNAGQNDGEEIILATGMTTAEFNRHITMLELKGRVRALGMNKWMPC